MNSATGLREWTREDFGLDLAVVEGVVGGSDVAAESWRAVARDGTAYALKRSSGTGTGLQVAASLAAQGVGGVPAPLRTRSGSLWAERGGWRLSVVPWVVGTERAAEVGLGAAEWSAFGALLAAVHAAWVPPDLAETLPREEYSTRPLRRRIDAVDMQVRAAMFRDPSSVAASTAWSAAAPAIERLLTQADVLADSLRAAAAPEVLCHGDPHLGNVLRVSGRAVLVDWDDALLAPPERDLVLLLGGMGPLGPQTAGELAALRAGYGDLEVDDRRLAYARTTRALEDLDWIARAVDDERTGAERAAALDVFRSVLDPAGLGGLALAARMAG